MSDANGETRWLPFLEAMIDPSDSHIYYIEYLHKNREKSVIIGHNRSSNPLGDLKTRVGWRRSVIFLMPIGQIEEAMFCHGKPMTKYVYDADNHMIHQYTTDGKKSNGKF